MWNEENVDIVMLKIFFPNPVGPVTCTRYIRCWASVVTLFVDCLFVNVTRTSTC